MCVYSICLVAILHKRAQHGSVGRPSAIPTISGEALRTRIRRLGLTYTQAAPRLGLSLAGLNKQMNGPGRVSRQTELLLDCLEQHQRDFDKLTLLR